MQDVCKKIFLTVGTTNFDKLVRFCDNNFPTCSYKFVFQIGNGKYLPSNHHYFRFTDKIDFYFQNADIIVTHAGAGTVYKLLEAGEKIIIVPNLHLKDNHQLELAEFVHDNAYAPVVFDFATLPSVVECYDQGNYEPYGNDNLFLIEKILKYLK